MGSDSPANHAELVAETIATYNLTASEYAENVQDLHHSGELERFASLTKGFILDVGCGSGRDARWFEDRGHHVIGIDLSENLLAIARATSPKSDFFNMDLRHPYSIHTGTMGGVWSVASLLHLPKAAVPAALDEFYRVLRSGGILYVAVKEGVGERTVADTRYGGKKKYYSYFVQGELEAQITAAGFAVFDSYPYRWNTSYVVDTERRIFAGK